MTKGSRRALIVTGIFPPDHGGPASYVPQICDSLMEIGWGISAVITLADHAKDEGQYRWPVIRVSRIQPRLLRFIKSIYQIYRGSRDVDIVYLNGLVLEGVIACKVFRRKPVVLKIVGDLIWEKIRNAGSDIGLLEFQTKKTSIPYALLKHLQKWYTKKADSIITPSRFLSTVVNHWGVPIDKISVIYNAVNIQYLTRPISQFSGAHEHCDFIFVGRLIQLKRVEIILEICIRNKWTLKIIGDGPEREKLERLAINSNGENLIKFLGYLPRNEVINELKKARVMTIFSAHETFPHVIIEAKAVGTPVIGSRVGGIPELIDHGVNGLLVNPEDTSRLEMSMRDLLCNHELQAKFIQNSKKQIEEEFQWASLVVKTEHVFNKTILNFNKQ
jgi:glycosyltransferase involved in cell wall biosynthesis